MIPSPLTRGPAANRRVVDMGNIVTCGLCRDLPVDGPYDGVVYAVEINAVLTRTCRACFDGAPDYQQKIKHLTNRRVAAMPNSFTVTVNPDGGIQIVFPNQSPMELVSQDSDSFVVRCPVDDDKVTTINADFHTAAEA